MVKLFLIFLQVRSNADQQHSVVLVVVRKCEPQNTVITNIILPVWRPVARDNGSSPRTRAKSTCARVVYEYARYYPYNIIVEVYETLASGVHRKPFAHLLTSMRCNADCV